MDIYVFLYMYGTRTVYVGLQAKVVSLNVPTMNFHMPQSCNELLSCKPVCVPPPRRASL